MTQEFLGLGMQNFHGTVFIWTQTYGKIFKLGISVPIMWCVTVTENVTRNGLFINNDSINNSQFKLVEKEKLK